MPLTAVQIWEGLVAVANPGVLLLNLNKKQHRL